MSQRYPSDVTDAEWTLLQPFFFPPGARRKAGRVETPESVRACLNAIRYLAKTGIAWADLPTCYGKPNSLWQRYNRCPERERAWRCMPSRSLPRPNRKATVTAAAPRCR